MEGRKANDRNEVLRDRHTGQWPLNIPDNMRLFLHPNTSHKVISTVHAMMGTAMDSGCNTKGPPFLPRPQC